MGDGSIKTIGRYEIEREIGRGGMAVVYKAFDPRLERAVAIKLIQSGAFGSNIFGHIRERFEREAKALAKLRHPNIVRVHDYGEHEGSPYLVMDYLEGATLKEVKKPLKVETAVRLIRPIADALDYVHQQGLLHRDVKPSNIMITPGQEVILTDFGIVKWLEDQDDFNTLTATGVGIGTPEYMAPEQGLGKPVDARSDAYALTVVFYELITGEKPYRGKTPVEVLMKQASEPIPDPRDLVPELSESVKRFLDRAMAKRPEDRYPTMADYLRDLDGLRLQALAGRPAKPSGTTTTGEIRTELRSEPGTDSSIRFGRTDLQKVRAGVAGAEPVGGERPAGKAPTAAADRASAIPSERKKRWGYAIFAALAIFAVAIGIRMAATQRAGITTGTAEAAKTIEAGLGETQTVLAGLRAASTETAAAAFRIETESGLNATLTQAALQTEIAVQRAAVAGTEQANAEAVQRREAELAAVSAVLTAQAVASETAQAATATAEARNPYANLNVGNRITFGSYEQDNKLSNGPEPIGWRVLEVSDGSALIVSEYALDARAYSEDYESVMWATCTLRRWLNGKFYDTAFNEEEKGLIALTKVKNADNPKYGTDGGKDTEDRVFLLSLEEAEMYFKDDEDRRAFPTEYAIAQDAYVNDDLGTVCWWLRSPGYTSDVAAEVDTDGSLGLLGFGVRNFGLAVRPALRLKINAVMEFKARR